MREMKNRNEKNIPAVREMEELPLMLTVEELMPVLKIGRNTAYALVRSGQLRSVRIGKQLRIPRVALDAYLQGLE